MKRRQAPRFKDKDFFPGQPGFVQKGKRYQGGLTRTGRSAEHRRSDAEGLLQITENSVNGKMRQLQNFSEYRYS